MYFFVMATKVIDLHPVQSVGGMSFFYCTAQISAFLGEI